MKTTMAVSTLIMALGPASGALAASGAREDNSGLFVWIFLGFCALIVVAQIMPAILLLFGFAKALGKSKPAEAQRVTNE